MPIFEYRCSACGGVFEQLVRKAGERVACPSCDSARVVRILSVPSTPRVAAGSPSAGPSGGSCCSGGGCGCHSN